jgi:hypothetical protein
MGKKAHLFQGEDVQNVQIHGYCKQSIGGKFGKADSHRHRTEQRQADAHNSSATDDLGRLIDNVVGISSDREYEQERMETGVRSSTC